MLNTAETRPSIFQEGLRRFKQPENLAPVFFRANKFLEDVRILSASPDYSHPFGIDWARRTSRFNHKSILLAALPFEIATKIVVSYIVGVPAVAVDIVSSPLRYALLVGKVIRERRHQP